MFIIWKTIFFQKVTVNKHQIFPFINNLKKPACASKQDRQVLTTLRYACVTCKTVLFPSGTEKHRMAALDGDQWHDFGIGHCRMPVGTQMV